MPTKAEKIWGPWAIYIGYVAMMLLFLLVWWTAFVAFIDAPTVSGYLSPRTLWIELVVAFGASAMMVVGHVLLTWSWWSTAKVPGEVVRDWMLWFFIKATLVTGFLFGLVIDLDRDFFDGGSVFPGGVFANNVDESVLLGTTINSAYHRTFIVLGAVIVFLGALIYIAAVDHIYKMWLSFSSKTESILDMPTIAEKRFSSSHSKKKNKNDAISLADTIWGSGVRD